MSSRILRLNKNKCYENYVTLRRVYKYSTKNTVSSLVPRSYKAEL